MLPPFRHTLRFLRRNPAFALVAIGTLALGIGATTAIVATVNAVLLRPLPYQDPDRLVILTETRRGEEISVAYPNLLDWREQSRTVRGIAGFSGRTLNLTGTGEPERLQGQIVTANLFGVLGVQPALGRGFEGREDAAGAEPTIILAHGLWRDRFGGDPGIIGRAIQLHDEPYVVIGVMPEGFDFPGGIVYGSAQFWIPAGLAGPSWSSRDEHPGIVAIGRLTSGSSLQHARAELAAIGAGLAAVWATNRDLGVRVTPALESLVGEYRSALLLLLAAVGLVLLIAVANVVNLLLVRAAGRQREMAVRHALGAGRRQLLAQLVVESLTLCSAGALAGLGLAWLSTRLAGTLLEGLPRGGITVLDWPVILTALGLTSLASLAGGLAPALGARATAVSIALRTREPGPGANRLRVALATVETALALMLLIGAMVVLKSFARIQADTGGIEPRGVLAWQISLPETRYGEGEPTARFYQEAMRRIAEIPGVEAAGAISVLPFSGSGSQSGITTADASHDQTIRTDVAAVTPGYFSALGVQVIAGRDFSLDDRAGAPVVGVVDERLAAAFWPAEDPLGKRLAGWGFREITIVGVVRHVKNYGVLAESRGELFVPHAQRPYFRMNGVLRTRANPADLERQVKSSIAALDPALPVYNMKPMLEVVGGTTARPRMAATLSGGFAGLALGLAMIGLYGVLAHGVVQRTREFGIRFALGATRAGVLGLVVRQALAIVCAGAALGITGALAGVRLLGSLTYGVDPADPALVLGVTAGFALVALAAAAAPALRASRVQPIEALAED